MDGEGKLTALDAAFLFFEQAGEPLVLGCVIELERSPGLLALGEALLRAVAAFPRLAAVPRRTPFDLERPSWTTERELAIGQHLARVPLADPGQAQPLADLLEDLLSRPLTEDRPPWDATLIEGAPDCRAVLLLRAHHCLVDGMGGLRILDALTEVAASDGGEAKLHGPRAMPRAGATLRAALAAPAALWERVKDVAEIANTAASLFHDDPAPELPFNGPLSPRRRLAWTDFDLAEVRDIARRVDATINDVVLSTISDAIRRWLGRKVKLNMRLRIAVPVSLHGNDEPQGNLFSVLLPSLPLDATAPLSRLERVRRETRALQGRGQARAVAFLLSAASALPASIEALLPRFVPERPLVNAVVTNIPGPSEPRLLAGVPILGLHGVVPLFRGMGLQFAALSHAGRLSLAASFDPAQVRDVRGLMRSLDRSFAELRQAARAAASRANPITDAVRETASTKSKKLTKRPQVSAEAGPAPRRARGYRSPPSLAQAAELAAATHRPARRRAG